MRVRLKRRGVFMDQKLEGYNSIDDVIIKQDILEPENTKISVFFKGKESSGIIDMSDSEVEKLISTLNEKLKEVRKVKKV